jgi:transposase
LITDLGPVWVPGHQPLGPERAWSPSYVSEQLRMIFQAELPEAKALLAGWISWAKRSQIPAFARLTKTITRFQTLILNAVAHRLSNARSEATNTHLRLLTRRA